MGSSGEQGLGGHILSANAKRRRADDDTGITDEETVCNRPRPYILFATCVAYLICIGPLDDLVIPTL